MHSYLLAALHHYQHTEKKLTIKGSLIISKATRALAISCNKFSLVCVCVCVFQCKLL